MVRFFASCICFVFIDCIVINALPPNWQTPSSNTFELDGANADSECDEVTQLVASSTDGSSVIYSLVSQTPDAGFAIGDNQFSGNKILTCVGSSLTTSPYTVVIRASHEGNGQSADKTLTITVTGVTPAQLEFVDPDPDETKDGHLIYVCETLQAGDEVMTLLASADSATFSMSDSPPATLSLFEIIGSKLMVKSGVATDALDIDVAEPVTEYAIVLKASDGGLVATLNTSIIVEPDNEHSPQFSGNFSAVVLETATAGTEVIAVTVTDQDRTPNETVVSLTLSESSEFELNGFSIQVAAGASFNVTTQSNYNLTVTATDDDPDDPKTTTQEYTITVEKVPLAFVDPDPDESKDGHIIYVCETVGAGDEVMTLRTNALNENSLTFSMSDSPQATLSLFEIVDNKLKVKTDVGTDPLDIDVAEPIIEYTIVLTVSDGTETSTLNTSIIVEADNDNSPEFNGSNSGTILESVAAGTEVIAVTVTDKDKTPNATVVSLTLSESSEFELNGYSIQVAAGASFNYTSQSTYTLTVTATDDDPDDPKTTTQEYTITVETEPRFNQLNTQKNATVNEDVGESATIFTLDISDRDESGNITITVIKSDELFEVVDSIVKLKSGKTLDAETKQTHEVQFNASDGTYEVTSAILSVFVNDINDNAPVFNDTDKQIDISETASIGTSVHRVFATDDDVSAPTLIYSLKEIGDSHFAINNTTGEITTTSTFTYSETNQFNLEVTVKDGNSANDKSATVVVTVKIKTAPTFEDPADGSTLNIEENTASGTKIKTITSNDPDGDSLTYELVSQTPSTNPLKFEVQDDSIFTAGTFDVDADDAIRAYIIQLKVSDGRSYTDDETISVTVRIDDSNDNTPAFSENEYKINVTETETVDTSVLQLKATDGDFSAPNNETEFSLSGSSDFRIDMVNGDLIVDSQLDYDTQSSYLLVVTVNDKGEPTNSVSTTVTVNILAEPKFDDLATAVSIQKDENLPATSEVYVVNVSDADDTWNGDISIISESPDGMFEMNGTSVRTKNTLDAEIAQTYSLTFKVKDGDFEVESQVLTINITDLNDNKPVLAAPSPVTIEENMTIGTEVIDLDATDGDVTEPNNVVTYAIQSGNDDDIFRIDPATGRITLEKFPQLEQYILTIILKDTGTPVLSSTTDVTINVNHTPVDECSPVPCKNGGTCESSVNDFTCTCAPGWTGNTCEINIDECSPNPCQNGGNCTDGINSYTCDCTEGLTGETCNEVCTNNTYGRNCAEACNCNVSRLAPDVETQQCDVRTGACKCSQYWTGTSCETDIDECSDASTCSGRPKYVCENTIGGFYCTCMHGYISNSGSCTKNPKEDTVTPTQGEVKVILRATINAACTDLTKPSMYNETKQKLEKMLNKGLPSKKRLVVVTITCGSINFTTEVIVDKANVADLSDEISNLRNNVDYDGENVPVNEVTVNDKPLNLSTQPRTAASVCRIYTSIEPCGTYEECIFDNGIASCKEIEKDHTSLILGLGLGVCLPLLLIALIAAIVYFCWMRKDRNRQRHHSRSSVDEKSPWHGRMKSNGVKIDTRNYDRNHYYDNGFFNGSLSDRKNLDVPGVGYTYI